MNRTWGRESRDDIKKVEDKVFKNNKDENEGRNIEWKIKANLATENKLWKNVNSKQTFNSEKSTI